MTFAVYDTQLLLSHPFQVRELILTTFHRHDKHLLKMQSVKRYGENSQAGILRMLGDIGRGFKEGNFLAKRLFVRDIRAMYRQSVLGLGWAFLLPIFSTVVWVYLNSTGLIKIATPDVPYPLFVLSGIILWQTFLEALNSPMRSFNNARSILTKINIPKEALILSGFYNTLFNLGIKLIVLIPLFFYYSHVPDASIIWAPFMLLAVVLLGFSIGILITPIGVLYTDIQRMIDVGSQMVFLLSPIIYPFAQEGSKAIIDRLNPMAVFINVARDTLVGTETPDIGPAFWIHVAVFSVVLIAGLVIYRVSIPITVERMGS